MDTGRLVEVLYRELNLQQLMETFVAAFQATISNPSDANALTQYQTARDALYEAFLENCRSRKYPPSKVATLEQIGGYDYTGPGMKATVERHREDQGLQSEMIQAQRLQQIQQQANAFHQSVTQARSGLQSLDLGIEKKKGAEFGLIFPRNVVTN